MSDSVNALLIFIKNPEKGNVKTRLAAGVGEERALLIYRALLEHTRRVALAAEAERYLFYSRFVDETDDWSPRSFHKRLQRGADLGRRMYHGFEEALSGHEKAVIIGSDCATLTPEIVNEAFRKLDEYDYVMGPALDGGYYLLGMRTPEWELFRDIPWSTDRVRALTLERIEALGRRCYLLPELSDIDEAADWERYGWEL